MNIFSQLNGMFASSLQPAEGASKYHGYLGIGKFEDGFEQWHDAMKAVARLPDGLPKDSRRKVWLTLAERHINSLKNVDWESTSKAAFNEMIDPDDDDELDYQIVKDLHRTGCSSFSGLDNDQERALLKRVLLAYARWNKGVGYCQGFNVIAAVILDVMDREEETALKVMIYLIDGVLPKSYFTDNLRDLAVDMAVFQELLATHLPRLHAHLDRLKREESEHDDDERPPLTDVYTMQWFLTLFATQLPAEAVLRVWDAVLLEGSEILIRTSLALWGLLQEEVLVRIKTADDFYTRMGEILTRTVDESSGIVEVDRLMTIVYQLAPFPLPQLCELRLKHFKAIGSQTSELEKWQRRLKERHAQASQYLQLTPQKLHKSYKRVTGLVLPSVPSIAGPQPVINHLKVPRKNSDEGKNNSAEAATNRRVLHIGAKEASSFQVSPTKSLTSSSSSTRDGTKQKSRSPQSPSVSRRQSIKEFRHLSADHVSSTSPIIERPESETPYRNPFPDRAKGKIKSKQQSDYGVKLGLYAPHQFAGGESTRAEDAPSPERLQDVTRITRHHINACLARESEAYNGGSIPR